MNGDSTGKVVLCVWGNGQLLPRYILPQMNGGTVSVVEQYEVRPGDVFAGGARACSTNRERDRAWCHLSEMGDQ